MPKLIITGELPDLNHIIDISKKHWAQYHAFKKKYTQLVAMIARAQLKPVGEYPVGIEIVWHCKNKRKDPDNIAAGKKFIMDGLVEAGILKGDAWKHIAELHDRFFVDAGNPRIEITLTT